ncbi:MAG: VOC family protein [Terrimicrobiaceae bacterium]
MGWSRALDPRFLDALFALALEVADLDTALDAARAAGVKITMEVMAFPGCRMFQLEDPDGNGFILHQRKA